MIHFRFAKGMVTFHFEKDLLESVAITEKQD